MSIYGTQKFIDDRFREKRLSELERGIPTIESLPMRPSILARFRNGDKNREIGKRLGRGVHQMASYLALSEGKNAQIARIRMTGKMLVVASIFMSEEDRALLERVRLAAFLRECPEELGRIKEHLHVYFKTKTNRVLFEKWKKEGFAEDAFLFNPTIPTFIFKAHLHNSVKQFGDSFQYDENTHEFKILVDGVYRNVAEIAETLSLKETKRLGGAIVSLVKKDNEKQKWFYLPQTGLQKWDEDGWKNLMPCATLNPAQVEFAQTSARRQDGSPGQKGDYVVEIVTTMQKYREIPLISGYQETFNRFKHPWIRIITPEGKFYSAGFNLGEDLPSVQPTAFVKGTFRSPDSWETQPFEIRPITGFAVSKEKCQAIIKEIESYQNKETKFSIIEKNCTAFIQRVRDILDPTGDKKGVSFAADITEVFKRCLPKTLQKIGGKLALPWSAIKYYAAQFCPPIMLKVARMAAAFFRLILERTAIAFSGRWFSYGKNINFPQKKDPHKGIPWYKFITHINIALEERLVRVFLPRKVGEWQQSLPQTRMVEKGTPLFAQYAATA